MKRTYSRANELLMVLGITMLATMAITGCSKDSGTNSASQGDIKMYMIDAPGDYDAVNVVVTEVSVHLASGDDASGWVVISDSLRTINLLNLTNGTFSILGVHRLDVGRYSQIRLKIGTGSTVVVDGQSHPLNIPSGTQSGLKLNHQFDIAADMLYELTLDFDADRSIHLTGNNQYQMNPVIRVVANIVSGSISGVVTPSMTFTHISTELGADSIGTYADETSGGFRLMALPAGIYPVVIESGNALFADTTITNINVTAQQNTNLGTIALRLR